MVPAIETLPLEQLARFCQKWRIASLYVFGSFVTGEFRQESDIDFLAELPVNPSVDFWGLQDMEDELAAIVGRDVDLVSKRAIEASQNGPRKESILGTAKLVFGPPALLECRAAD